MQDPHFNNPAAFAWQSTDQNQDFEGSQSSSNSADSSRKRLSLDLLTRGAGAIASMSPNALRADKPSLLSTTFNGIDLASTSTQAWPSELTKANKISAKAFTKTESQLTALTGSSTAVLDAEPKAAEATKAIAYAAWGLDLEADIAQQPTEKSRAFRETVEAEPTIPVQDYVAMIRQTESLTGPMQSPYQEALLLNDDEVAFTKAPERLPERSAAAVSPERIEAKEIEIAPEKIVARVEEKRSPAAVVAGLDIKSELQKFKADGVAFVKTIDPSGLRIQVQTAKDFSTLTETWMPGGENGKYFYNMELQDSLKRKVHEESVNLSGARTVVQTIYEGNSSNATHKVMTKPDGSVIFLEV